MIGPCSKVCPPKPLLLTALPSLVQSDVGGHPARDCLNCCQPTAMHKFDLSTRDVPSMLGFCRNPGNDNCYVDCLQGRWRPNALDCATSCLTGVPPILMKVHLGQCVMPGFFCRCWNQQSTDSWSSDPTRSESINWLVAPGLAASQLIPPRPARWTKDSPSTEWCHWVQTWQRPDNE